MGHGAAWGAREAAERGRGAQGAANSDHTCACRAALLPSARAASAPHCGHVFKRPAWCALLVWLPPATGAGCATRT